jgi:superoxide reductase
MTRSREIYHCPRCGNVIEVLYPGAPALVCCGDSMDLLEAKKADSSLEKHVPVVKETDNGIKVLVGSTLHPMTEDHHIAFIEVLTKDKVYRAELDRTGEPVACFNININDVVCVREYCNKHGLWKATL